MNDWRDDLIARIEAHTATVAVIGLGYVGLPLALRLCDAGFDVTGVDTDQQKIATLRNGGSPLDDVDPSRVKGALKSDRFRPTDDLEVLAEVDIAIVCVPTPLAGETPDLTYVLEASDALGARLRGGSLIVLESTTYPGTTEEVVRPRLEGRGLVAGDDFALAYAPERIDPGNATFGVENIPRIVGGLTEGCARVAQALYEAVAGSVVIVPGPREAELAKLLENTYRQVNIALVNEFAMVAHELDIDIWKVIDAAATKPFGFQPFWPGVGIGGHCIAVDPVYLTWRIRELGRAPFRLVEMAREVDDSMPLYISKRITDTLVQDGVPVAEAKVMLLGVTYKPDVADVRGSRALEIGERLIEMGVRVSFHDPFHDSVVFGDIELKGTDLEAGLAEADLVAILTHHSSYDWPAVVSSANRVFDARGATLGIADEHITRL